MVSKFIDLTLASSGRSIAINASDISTFQEHVQCENSHYAKLNTLITMKSGKEIIVDHSYGEVTRLIEDDDDL